ncbi:DUF456 domain-containing protein [Gordonia araii]|nr:DUF456 domain-containing protein [Gordonia araii]NNG98661.1 DUF456 domain-containing protein [Gordonia araii NBRC 100433]
MLAAAVAALLVVEPATAGARTPVIDTGPAQVSLTKDMQAVSLKVGSGSIKQVGNELLLMNSKGAVKSRVPLTVKAEGKTAPLRAQIASDAKSAELKPFGYHPALTYRRPLPRPRNKGQAWDQMNALANQNWGCAAPSTLVGGLIGLLVGFIILGWITVPIGAAIGAYVGYDNCGRGRWGDRYRSETIRAFWRWWNMPG